jgi:membrane-bound serine protease (ClpP class)
MKRIFFNALCLFMLLLNSSVLYAQDKQVEAQKYAVKKLTFLEVNASINPAVYNYLENNIRKLNKSSGDFVVIKLDTPGGLVSTTKDILTLMGSSDYPIAVWITPEAASATSAGAIIASGAHVLVMSEGTNIGAATPITMGKDLQKDARSKAVNDLVALVRSLSKARGRNADEFEKMISKAKSLDAQEALSNKYQLKVNGEIWNATSEETLAVHDKVKIIQEDSENLVLKVYKSGAYNKQNIGSTRV